MATVAPPSPAEAPAFQPFVPPSQHRAEFTPRALALGAVLGIVFAASSVYLALKIGLTVSASIPIAVLAVAFFRTLGRSTILENNIVQTIGSSGESIAAGIVFTIPAILLMGYDLSIAKVTVIALVGFGLVQAATCRALAELDAGRSIRAVDAYRLALRRAGPLAGTFVIVIGAWLALGATGVLVPVAVWLIVRWALAVPAVELEGLSARASVRRSTALVRGRWLRVRGTRKSPSM